MTESQPAPSTDRTDSHPAGAYSQPTEQRSRSTLAPPISPPQSDLEPKQRNGIAKTAGSSHLAADPTPGTINGHTPSSPSSPTTTPLQPSASPQPLNGHTPHSPSSPTITPLPPSAYPQPLSPKHTVPPPKLISTHLISHPTDTASRAIRTVFPKPNPISRLVRRFKVKHSVISGLTHHETKHWEAEGPALRRRAGWRFEDESGEGVVIGKLFWKMYISLLPTLERDPLSGLVPPDLMGSTSTMPLSIISLIPDIMQHYHDVIVRAEKEIFLATNYWQPSNSVNTISGSLRDLSALIIKDKRPKVVVKIMYDRGSWEQLWNAHAPVNPDEWAPLDLPTKEDVPGLIVEVVNFHRVLLGTFHAKFLLVDRKVALINSNNIQDRPNLELMSHLEGPVVDGFYEIALHSWYNALSPPLPCMTTPYQPPIDSHTGKVRYLFQEQNPYFDDIEILKAARAARILLRRQTLDLDGVGTHGREKFRFAVMKVVDQQRHTLADWRPGDELEARAQYAMKELREFRDRWGFSMGSRAGSRSGSRAPSRAPSRRNSAAELHNAHVTDERTAAIAAHNAAVTLHGAPSEAPSTPTVVGDGPVNLKPLVIPPSSNGVQSAADHDNSQNGHEPSRHHQHVIFVSPEADGTEGKAGNLSHGEAVLESPVDRGPSIGTGLIVGSPAASSLHLASDQTPAQEGKRGRSPVNQKGEALPVTAQMPTEIESVSPSNSPSRRNGDAEYREKSTTAPEIERKGSDAPPEGTGSKRLWKLSKRFNEAGVLSEAWGTVEDSDDLDNFSPHVVHAPHDPFPIALCCRKPHGLPGHHDIRNPQNAAWLAGFRYAKRKVFVQTPTLNARPIVRAIKQACRRGVDVVLYLDLGFNDKGESIPFQGGTNEEVVERLYRILRKDKKEQYLKVYWYTGKDQVRPLNAVVKQRNCHIKFAAYDDEVLIIGNGNQDSQSWFHSQEVNVMIDNRQIIAEMMETLLSNQNTKQYGLVDTDGIWRDKEGKTLEDFGATKKGQFRGLSAFIQYAKSI